MPTTSSHSWLQARRERVVHEPAVTSLMRRISSLSFARQSFSQLGTRNSGLCSKSSGLKTQHALRQLHSGPPDGKKSANPRSQQILQLIDNFFRSKLDSDAGMVCFCSLSHFYHNRPSTHSQEKPQENHY